MINNYLLFELDHGGTTNIIIALKFIIYLCYITNRVLIIPPSQSIYHFDWGPNGINETTKDFKNITKTSLYDIIDFNMYKKYIKIISFDKFYKKEKNKLNLPKNYQRYHQIHSYYNTMKNQGNRLRKSEKNNRGLYWLNMAIYLEKIKENYNEKNDWVLYAKENFNTIKFKNRKNIHNISKFLEKVKNQESRIIFLPMDDNFMLNDYKYPRIFVYGSKFNIRDKIWDSIISIEYFSKFIQEISNTIIEKYLSKGNYDALHWRYKGFNEKKEYNKEQILDKIKKWIKYDKLYISSDSYDKFFNKTDNKFNIKIFSIKDMSEYKDINKKYISFIEQLICIRSNIFIGTNISSFSSEILNIRTKRLNYYRDLNKKQDSKNYFL